MTDKDKTHYRKVFNSPYLSSADITGPTVLTISRVTQEVDKTKKTKDVFNTAYFVERELRPGEALKPMILNATNSKTMHGLTGSHFIEDWQSVKVMVYVDHNVKFGKEVMEGLRISTQAPAIAWITPDTKAQWERAKVAFIRDGNLDAVLARVSMTEEHQQQLMKECRDDSAVA